MRFPLDEDVITQRVNITGGILAGRSGHIDSISDEPQPSSAIVELDGDGAHVWIDADDLEEEPERPR